MAGYMVMPFMHPRGKTPKRTSRQGQNSSQQVYGAGGPPGYGYGQVYPSGSTTSMQSMTPPPSYHSGYPTPQQSNSSFGNYEWQTPTQALPPRPGHDSHMARTMNRGGAFVDRVGARLNDMLSRTGEEDCHTEEIEALARGLSLEDLAANGLDVAEPTRSRPTDGKERSSTGVINFKKSWLYKNSRLPPSMLPYKAYLDTWTLCCRAAQSSVDVYNRPKKDQREFYSNADPRLGTKATIIKSQPIGDRQLIIVAIRGSQKNFVDWAVNFRPAPTEPTGFLDDEGNACHAGFLQVARSMIGPVAAQLKQLIEQDPSLATCSLLFTGHSAGGAVASLIYAHMLSARNQSALTDLGGLFKRIHCITFGAPPITLLPLQKPTHRHDEKFVFISFVNEGDPVVRADKQYVVCLARLVAAPAPAPTNDFRQKLKHKMSRQVMKDGTTPNRSPPRWPVPEATLSIAGRAVLLREKPNSKSSTVEARQLTDGELRDVIFGDPSMHPMALYRKRVEDVACSFVTGRDG